jgi:hypothetical protein
VSGPASRSARGDDANITEQIRLMLHTWREPLPEGESAWISILQSTAGAAVHALPPGQQQHARENFLANLTGHRAGNQTDAQRLYVATRTRS